MTPDCRPSPASRFPRIFQVKTRFVDVISYNFVPN
jgi:hypothetical protein